MRRILSALAVLFAVTGGPAWADPQTYAVALGGRQLGTLQFNGQSRNAAFLLSLNNAPFGIKNGSFNAVTQSNGNTASYLGANRGSETRDIAIDRTAGRVTSVEITPSSEMTELSDAKAVPPGVLFPPELFAALATGNSCPSPLALYDGRRVVQVATQEVREEGPAVHCDMSYRVVMGPGYVSPFYLKSFGMALVYTAGTLTKASLSGGGFKVHLIRQ
ncbi:MAG: hypothetical protein ABJG14_17715 [Sulfitobacter sp.]|jgi:hypothetical protein|uniref:hypothetical protein n=1 Tax=Sulfitobacter sp. TaxID=1903071 RepID=UPI000C56F305|nr:hypothetical protein [Sulfitobacter sp.]MAP15494.1 hypothetical protein [Sulfitobacter sp.]MBD82883.1 hypothetical protein [Sulfitobacter sp.]HCQ59121.1 hypothetical protein [Sulfitobacter sp.]|tara:strand:+ start:2340 stop:2993 length:654 start_codon:yes stop_codon:yes gene_type:complete